MTGEERGENIPGTVLDGKGQSPADNWCTPLSQFFFLSGSLSDRSYQASGFFWEVKNGRWEERKENRN